MNKFKVRLTDEELLWPRTRIITAVDNGGVCDDESWARIASGGHPGHFGGSVEFSSSEENTAYVVVYID